MKTDVDMMSMEKTIELLQAAGRAQRASVPSLDATRDARVRGVLLRAMTENHPQRTLSFFAILQARLQPIFALRPMGVALALFVVVLGVASFDMNTTEVSLDGVAFVPHNGSTGDEDVFAPSILLSSSGLSTSDDAVGGTGGAVAPQRNVAAMRPRRQAVALAPSVGVSFAPSVVQGMPVTTFAKSVE